MEEPDITIIKEARQFWIHYAEGRALFAAFLQIKRARVPAGDWALFSYEKMEALLPNVILPDHCVRRNYICNYVHAQDCLDLYSESWRPLVQHPFPSELNPLVFSRPRRLNLN